MTLSPTLPAELLNFDEERFLRILRGAVDTAEPLREIVRKLLAEGRSNLYFLGTGGAAVLMQPAAQLISRSSQFPVFVEHAAEIVHTASPQLGRDSIVVVPSLSGTTQESVGVLAFAQSRGAHVITLTGHRDTPLAQAADTNVTLFAEDDTSSETFYLQSLILALALLDELDVRQGFDQLISELIPLPSLLVDVKRAFEPRAAELAKAWKDESYHIITGAGNLWPQAWYYGTCILEEMQWIRTRPVHASDFFHGTLELLESDVSLFILKGEDAARPLIDPVEAFAPTVSAKVNVLDTAAFPLPGV